MEKLSPQLTHFSESSSEIEVVNNLNVSFEKGMNLINNAVYGQREVPVVPPEPAQPLFIPHIQFSAQNDLIDTFKEAGLSPTDTVNLLAGALVSVKKKTDRIQNMQDKNNHSENQKKALDVLTKSFGPVPLIVKKRNTLNKSIKRTSVSISRESEQVAAFNVPQLAQALNMIVSSVNVVVEDNL